MLKRFIGSSDTARALSSAGTTTFAINIIGTAIGFGLQVLLARSLGADEFGAYSYVISWLTVLVLFCTLGFDSALVRFVASYRAKNELGVLAGVLRTSALAVLICSGLIAATLGITVSILRPQLDPRLITPFFLGAILLPIWALFSLMIGVLQGVKLYSWARVPQFIIRPLLMCLCVGAALIIGMPLSARSALSIHILALLVVTILSALQLSKTLRPVLRGVTPVAERGIWFKAGLALMLVGTLQSLASQIDTILLGALLPLADVGVYSVAARISTLILFGMQAINLIAAPMIAEAYASHQDDEAKRSAALQELASRIARWIAFFSFPLTFAVLIFGAPVLSVFGAQYTVGYSALVFLSLGQIINISAGPVGFMLTMTGNESTSVRVLIIAILANIILLYPLVWLWGLNGAAIATGISIALRNILALIEVKRILKVDPSLLPIAQRLWKRFGARKN